MNWKLMELSSALVLMLREIVNYFLKFLILLYLLQKVALTKLLLLSD